MGSVNCPIFFVASIHTLFSPLAFVQLLTIISAISSTNILVKKYHLLFLKKNFIAIVIAFANKHFNAIQDYKNGIIQIDNESPKK
jgi:hypothetical protein